MDPAPAPTKASGVRARVRAQLTAEIKEAGRRQLATEGAGSISLRAIAREMEMSSSAVYRYYASRDELLTALILDAYNGLGDAVDAASATTDADDLRGRLLAIATAVRSWAIANPHEYALIYGSPVPGYAAPEDTVDPAVRVAQPILAVVIEHALTHGRSASEKASPDLARALGALASFVGDEISADALADAVRVWGEMFGLINLELFGHFHNVVDDPETMFHHAMAQAADRVLS